MPVAAVAGLAVAGGIASSVAKKNAADKAAAAQKKALSQQQSILQNKLDPEALNKLAQTADTERAKNRLALQQAVDPELASLRTLGKQQLLEQAQIPEGSKQSTQLANRLFSETNTPNELEGVKNSIIQAAQKEIDAGATLPPEFQGELVRAGLNTGSQSGIGITKNSIGGGVARALGMGGIQLQQQREQAAQQLAGTAQSLISARSNLLSSVFPKLRDLETQRRVEAAQNFQLADQSIPESGLSGQDVVNLKVAQQKGVANLLQSQANVKATQATNQGNFLGSVIGAGTNLGTSVLGAPGVAGSIFGSRGIGNPADNGRFSVDPRA